MPASSTERLHLNTFCARLPIERPYGVTHKQITSARHGTGWSVGSTCFTPVPPQPTGFCVTLTIFIFIEGSGVHQGWR
jgi:hypothetical protein